MSRFQIPGQPPPEWPGRLLRRAREWVRGTERRVDRWAGDFRSRPRPRLRRLARALRRRAPAPRQVAFLVFVLLGPVWILWERCGLSGCPDVDRLTAYQPGGASVLLDRHGGRFADLAPMDYEVVPLDSLPDYVGEAFIAVEDQRFLEHDGVDWRRVLGAMWADIAARSLVQGSSTIPMQLSRTLFSDRIRREEKTLRRKLLEVRVAGEIEERFTKREILELYLNHVYLGGGSFGVQAASRYYFGKGAPELELDEAALLAALPKAPSNYDPRRHPEPARARRDLVLALMAEQEYLSFDEVQSARTRELGVADEPDRDRGGNRLAPYFIQNIRRLLEDRLGQDFYDRPLRVMTTLDPRLQEAAEDELEAQLLAVERGRFGRLSGPAYRATADPDAQPGYLQGAVVVMDARNGDVLAWVGGRDYSHSRFDRAHLARRQAGSAFKPFIYGAAIEAGYALSQPIMDAPFRLARRGARDWNPENYTGMFEGRMSMREALTRSQNVPAVRLAASVGDEAVKDFAGRAGITGEVPASPVAALGVTALSPLEMTVAYTSFARLGTRVAPRFVLRVETVDGDRLWEATEPQFTPVTDTATAFMLTDILRDVVDRGTGVGVRSGGFYGPAAGKTGTTNDATDVWFVGYTPELVGTVWVGFDEVRPLPYRATGGGVAAPVWGRIMARASADRSASEWWPAPSNVVSVTVDPETGLALEDGCYTRTGGGRQELFLAGDEPSTVCPRRRSRGFFGRVRGWFGSRDPAPRIPGPEDPDLGVPRIPRRGEIGGDRTATSPTSGGARARGPRISVAEHPPQGQCRIWDPARESWEQPPPARCGELVGSVPVGTFLLYDGRIWDTDHDWRAEAARRPGSVPDIVLRIMGSLVRR